MTSSQTAKDIYFHSDPGRALITNEDFKKIHCFCTVFETALKNCFFLYWGNCTTGRERKVQLIGNRIRGNIRNIFFPGEIFSCSVTSHFRNLEKKKPIQDTSLTVLMEDEETKNKTTKEGKKTKTKNTVPSGQSCDIYLLLRNKNFPLNIFHPGILVRYLSFT